MACNYKRMFQCIHVSKEMFILLTKCQTTLHSDHKPVLTFFIGHTDNDKFNIYGLKAAAIPRIVKVQHIKGIANVFADPVSSLKAVGLYHDISSIDHQQEFSTSFEPLPPVEPVTHTPIEVHEVFITPDIEGLAQMYDTLHDSPTAQTSDDVIMSLENPSPTDILQLGMSLPEVTPEKGIKIPKNDAFCNNTL